MATFKEFISPIVKVNKKEGLLDIVDDANRIIEGVGDEKMITENGTAIVGIAFCFKGDEKQDLRPFEISLVATDDNTDNEIVILLSEEKTKNLIDALQKKLAEIKMLNVYTKPLREM